MRDGACERFYFGRIYVTNSWTNPLPDKVTRPSTSTAGPPPGRETCTSARRAAGGQRLPAYVEEVRVESSARSTSTGLLLYTDDVEKTLVQKEGGEVLADWPYAIAFPNGEVRRGRTDEVGSLRERDVPPGAYSNA